MHLRRGSRKKLPPHQRARYDHWFWGLSIVVRPPLRGHGYADTGEQALADFRAAWERCLAKQADSATRLPPDYGPARDGDGS